MDRKVLVELFRKGMEYPPGRHQLWVRRCFEIRLRSDQVVEIDEYESFSTKKKQDVVSVQSQRVGPKDLKKMFHVGRSILNLKDKQVVEEKGAGWKEFP